MDIDLDTGTMGIFSVGQESEMSDRYLQGPGYAITIRDHIVQIIAIHFSGFMESDEVELRVENKTHRYVSHTPGLINQDRLIKNGRPVDINSGTTPEEVSKIFEMPIEFWDDESEISMSFVWRGMEFEFSWRWIDKDLKQLHYMFIESVSNENS